jgi:hypothetical protein
MSSVRLSNNCASGSNHGAGQCSHRFAGIGPDRTEVEACRVDNRNPSVRICASRGRTEGNEEQEQPSSGREPVLQLPRLWREHTPYRSDEDWIFASPHHHGKTPYTYQILFRRHIRPVIEKVAGIKSSNEATIGWHTLRRSLATLLISNGENVKVAQSQLRHTTPKITLDLYAQAVSADQQEGHKKVIHMVLLAQFSEKLKASVTATA